MDETVAMFGCRRFKFATDEVFEGYSGRGVDSWYVQQQIWDRGREAHRDG